jgi:protein arginine kinase
MKLDDLIKKRGEWLKGTGPDSDIVISSRIRIARNLKKFPFSDWSDKKSKEVVLEEVKKAIDQSNYFKGSLYLRLGELSDVDRQFLLERQLISRELATKKGPRAVCISDKEIFSIMINEEDHLRIQVIQSGFNFSESWRIIDKIDDELNSNLEFAFSSRLGFLTACPTNIGTGMRASAMLHLPTLVMNKQIEKILQAIAKLSFTTRGLYGEGSEATGNFFQISNQITLGTGELAIIDNIERIIKQVIDYEKNSRIKLLERNSSEVEDKIYRAYGILKSARLISSSETIELLSMVRLGVDLGLIKEIDRSLVNELFVLTQPAHLQKIEGKQLTPKQRDIKRAQLIRERLK